MPFGILYMTKFPALLPFLLPKYVQKDLTNKFSIIYTNLNSTTQPLCFDGKYDIEHYFLVPGYGNVSTGFSICTMGQRMSIGCFSDEVYMKNPQEFCDIFKKNNDKILDNDEYLKAKQN